MYYNIYKLFLKEYVISYLKVYSYSMLRLLCSCIKDLADKDKDGDIDFFEKKLANTGGLNSPLDDLLRENLLSIKARRARIRNIPIDIPPTKFDDDDDPPSEDEDGEETSTVKHGVFAGQHFHKIREKCLQSGKLFVDPMFPPSNTSLFTKQSECQQNHNIKWKRASEMCENPRLFVDGASRFDIMQGELGDCWLLAAMANLTLHKKLFYQVAPQDQSFTEEYAGIFHFR